MVSHKPLNNILNFIAFSNVWIALAAISQTFATYFIYRESVNLYLLFFIFCSSLLTYNILRIQKLKSISPDLYSEQMKWFSKNLKTITVILILSFAGSALFFFFLSLHQKMIMMISGLIVLGYNLPISEKKITLRKIPFLKSFLISGVWTLVTFLAPISQEEFLFPVDEFLMRFLFVFAISIPFDIRDLKYDDAKMKTMPQIFGKTGSVLLGLFILCGSSFISYSIYPENYFLPLILSYLATGIVLILSIKPKDDLFYSILVDGMLVLQLAFIILNR